ncbi:DUF4123 domain-containing protein [Massilia antarctica]|uniref:DUF4123 domain-containing protein n=1 Tax=Massilia antarctica TaxID=2765360 RepID=UPI0006BB9771|nr:DUF4123 domain-containing protein [Massilia sp. H27-R4]MCY0912618.1 DUF4123 domain-containing protein [Massilia sp. H27-R4]CUI03679.1 hypothetical protein BN2497_2135 [Janthinobacterium sp. CG23_2]CUU27465.1 hypothetical protein BN3177_2135 [Janthinobacterium sp. CG23_2]
MMVSDIGSGSFALGLEALGLLDAERPGNDATLYSLIDGAKFAGLGKIRLPSDGSAERYSLLGDMAQKGAIDAGPVLLRHTLGARCPVLAKILTAPDSANFSSVIVSGLPLSLLLKRLTWLTDVVHDDGTEWVMRYYDPLILPHWLDVLDETQRTLALAGIGEWLYVDMRGRAQIVRGIISDEPAGFDSAPMLLKQHQCDDLMNRTLPYMIMDQLVSDDPQALGALPPYESYDFFFAQLGKAQGYGLGSVTDLKSYCVLSLMMGADFDKTLVVAQALKDVGPGASFSERMLAWTPEQWEALEVNSGPNV